MNSKQLASKGIAKAIYEYTKEGYSVFTPINDVSRFDLVIEKEGTLKKVEVKTCNTKKDTIQLRTLGGNRSWSGEVKRISTKDCDEVFMYNYRLDIFSIKSSDELSGRTSIVLK